MERPLGRLLQLRRLVIPEQDEATGALFHSRILPSKRTLRIDDQPDASAANAAHEHGFPISTVTVEVSMNNTWIVANPSGSRRVVVTKELPGERWLQILTDADCRVEVSASRAILPPEEIDFAYNPALPAPLIRDLAALRFLERGESVLLYGPVGVGKTHVASALGHLACRRGYSVLFAKTSRVLAEFAGGRADGSWEQRLRRLARFDLLILDDFALRPFTTSQGDDFYELVSERAGRASFILTANRSPKDWYELFPNAVVAEGVLDRLVNSSFHVHMEGKSYRPKRRPGQSVKLEKGAVKG